MKRNLVIAVASCMLLTSAPAHAFDWGLGNKIVTNMKSMFSRAIGESNGKTTQSEFYKNKEDETLSEFLENARLSGFVTKTGSIDYNKINQDPKMVAHLNAIMSNIEPAAGPASNISLNLKPEKITPVGSLRPVRIK